MLIIYGWRKEGHSVKQALECYCYVCQRNSDWYVWRESEWVTFFGVKTIPFIFKHFLICAQCKDKSALTKKHLRHIMNGKEIPDETITFLEQYQLGSKNAVQRNYLLSMKAERESNR
jgi:hypothetical protein